MIFLNDGSRPNSLSLGSEQVSYLQFNYLACDLKRLPAKDYQDSENIVARLNLPNMRYAKDERLQIDKGATNRVAIRPVCDGDAIECIVTWREGKALGIRFIGRPDLK